MNLYLTYDSIPELRGLPKEEQRKAWRACAWSMLGSVSWWLGLVKIWAVSVMTGLPVLILTACLMFWLRDGPFILTVVVVVLGSCVVGASGGLVAHREVIKHIRPRLKQYVEREYRAAND